MDAVETLDALNEVVATRIVGRVDEVEARLVDGDGVKGGKNADIFHTRVLRHGAAVAVDGHVLHHVDVDDLAVEKLDDGLRRVGHGLKEGILLGRPHLFGLARAVDVRLACAGRASDGELFERAAEAAHRVALEVGKNEHGIIIFDILADQILLDALAVRDGELKIGTLGIENVDIEELAPAVFDHRAAVGVGRVALAGIGGVALNDGAVYGLEHRQNSGVRKFWLPGSPECTLTATLPGSSRPTAL